FSSQVKDFLGLKMGTIPADFTEKWVAYAEHFKSINIPTLLVAFGTLAMLVVWPRISRLVPAPFVAMLLATLVVQLFHLPVETIGSRFGAVPSSLPAPHLPVIPWYRLKEFISPALADGRPSPGWFTPSRCCSSFYCSANGRRWCRSARWPRSSSSSRTT